jgi:hypothetical protein
MVPRRWGCDEPRTPNREPMVPCRRVCDTDDMGRSRPQEPAGSKSFGRSDPRFARWISQSAAYADASPNPCLQAIRGQLVRRRPVTHRMKISTGVHPRKRVSVSRVRSFHRWTSERTVLARRPPRSIETGHWPVADGSAPARPGSAATARRVPGFPRNRQNQYWADGATPSPSRRPDEYGQPATESGRRNRGSRYPVVRFLACLRI